MSCLVVVARERREIPSADILSLAPFPERHESNPLLPGVCCGCSTHRQRQIHACAEGKKGEKDHQSDRKRGTTASFAVGENRENGIIFQIKNSACALSSEIAVRSPHLINFFSCRPFFSCLPPSFLPVLITSASSSPSFSPFSPFNFD